MATDAEISLAFVAKRQGKASMPASEWAHVLSLELGWLAPGAAKAFVAGCESSGLLAAEGELLTLSFHHSTVSIPNRYRPPTDLEASSPSADAQSMTEAPLDVDTKDWFPRILARICKERNMEKADVLSAVDATQERFGGRLTADAAIILVGLAQHVDVKDDAAAALSAITSAAK